jgi:hypothetical protein
MADGMARSALDQSLEASGASDRESHFESVVDADDQTAHEATLKLLLWSGGDERLRIDPRTGRNRYGVPVAPADNEVWFATSTASAVSPRGYAAAGQALQRILRGHDPLTLPDWFDSIRLRLLDLFGALDSEIILSASGTEAELLALAAASSLSARPLTNVIVAPHETGRGVTLAADGRYFLPSSTLGGFVEQGARLRGLENRALSVEVVELRDPAGRTIEADQVDEMVADRVEAALASGSDVLLHLLDCSKTGLSGPSRVAAAHLATAHPDRVTVVVDACQLRCAPEQVRADLDGGFAVMLTGSKFAGGPPFAGALLLPAALAARLHRIVWPEGLAAYSAALDWRSSTRARIQGVFAADANIGLGLRWECALAELERYFAIDGTLRRRIAREFAQTIAAELAASPGFKLVDPDFKLQAEERTIFPVLTFDERGEAVSADALHNELRLLGVDERREPHRRRAFHLGQPVPVGRESALRVCLGAPLVNAVADRMSGDADAFAAAFKPLADDVRELFGWWRLAADGRQAARRA